MLPVTVSHVCRTWRSLALLTPQLWRRINVDLSVALRHKTAEMWKERIQRAKACTLDVKLLSWFAKRGLIHHPQLPDASSVQWYMYLINPTVHRWRSLEIRFIHYAPFLWNAALSELCSRSSNIRALCLEELTLVYPRNDDAKEFCLFSGSAPRLTRLTVDGVRLTWLPSLFHNLTYLDYTHHGFTGGPYAIYEIIALLRTCCRLIELALSWPLRNVDPLVPNSLHVPALRRVALPCLSTLRLKVDTADIPRELGHLLTFIYTPALLYLHYMDPGRRRHPFPSLQSFLHTYPPPTSTRLLSLEHGWYNDIILFNLLNRLPHLQQIVVKHLHLPNEVFHVYSSL